MLEVGAGRERSWPGSAEVDGIGAVGGGGSVVDAVDGTGVGSGGWDSG